MLAIRKSEGRGHVDYGWLDTRHTFSFGEYYDPRFMGFRALRVINEDRVRGGAGFPTHPHRDMEILTYVLDGALEHRDSIGNGSVIRPGEIQRMSAGTGVTHSEYNHSKAEPVHFLQIWLQPRERGLRPSYEQASFAPEELDGSLRLIASTDGRLGSVTIHQDVDVYAATLTEGARLSYRLGKDRYGWLHVARGALELGGERIEAGDGVAMVELDEEITVTGLDDAELLLFDLA